MVDGPTWDLLLRGAVGGVLLFHAANLLGRGPRPAARAALGLFTLSLLAYLGCQRVGLLVQFPRPLVWGVLALCTSATAWLWLAARALFDDRFRWDWPLMAAAGGMVALGLASNAPRLEAMLSGRADPGPGPLTLLHAAAMVGFTAAAVWEVLRGWRDDLVEPRRVARRWVALGIGVYAAIALAVELAVRDRPVGLLLPALHVAGIGVVALALALLVARRSLAAVLGQPVPAAAEPTAGAPASPAPPQPPSVPGSIPPRASPALQRLQQAMTEEHAYRREGLSVASLAAQLGMGEAALRSLINQQLGYRNFNDFLHHHRLQEAAERLATEDLPILSIALACGYGSIGPFNRAFRQRFGMTPTEYRAGARLKRHQTAG
ncbi:MAG: helix-turn-helix transcriptional regulator [Xanthomonadales bacterium]|nr:helix-turn-helix transcriptional regulator [Xanthomonadales bacterium]